MAIVFGPALVDAHNGLYGGPHLSDPIASLRGISKSFGSVEVLKAIDLTLAKGEFVALVGRSGCGKSTLLRLLAGLEVPTTGDVRIGDDGQVGWAAGVRVMFQEPRLLPWRNVIDNVGIGMVGAWQPKAQAALDEVGLRERWNDWPAILSGGQRQRVALARALTSSPKLLLLDEPLGALDALTRLDMQALIRRVWEEKGFTALLVTHDVSEAVALADRVLLIEDGRITFEVTVDLPRPRRRECAEIARIEALVLKQILDPPEDNDVSSHVLVAEDVHIADEISDGRSI